MTKNKRENLVLQLNQKVALPSFIWSEYTIEASILSDISAFSELIHRALLGNDVNIEIAIVNQTVTRIVNEHCIETLRLLNENEELQRKISGQILNRSQKWSSCVGITNLFPSGVHNHLINYQSYARSLLQKIVARI